MPVAVQIVLPDGFDPLDVIAPFEIIAAGSDALGGGLDVELVSAEGPQPVVPGTRGLVLTATADLDPHRPGVIIVPEASGPVDGDPDDVTIQGDEMTGVSRAGRLPRTQVAGRRVAS